MSREEHNKMAMIDNLVWEIAKILIPNSFIDPKRVADAKSNLRYTYLNFLERLLREKFGFVGSPIKMWVEKSTEKIHETNNRPG